MSTSAFPEILGTLFKRRNLSDEERESFLNPSYESLHDPLLLPQMALARDRIIEAIKNGEKIAVFSDYDADGIPGAVVLSDFFKRINYENVSFYIPHRHDEGFGLNRDFVESCEAKVLITVDCGTADTTEVLLAKQKGIDVIITDHHEAHEWPEALATVNPKRPDSEYPFKELCGAALAYKLVQAILAQESFGLKAGIEKWSLDMVGIATLSDMVPLVGENRILAKFGLEVLRKSPRPGLQALFKKLRMDQKHLTEDDVTFMITPRINAASRMGEPEDAFNLLATTNQVEAEQYANHLEKINQERKGVVAGIVKEAKKHLEARETLNPVIVIGNPDWKPSLLGLVANSLVEEYERPAFVFGRDGEGVLKGSCRSYNGYDLFELMSASADHFIEFGGHKGAGGFSISLEKVGTLEERLGEVIKTSPPTPLLDLGEGSISVQLSDIGEELWQTVSQFAPFGMGNEKPVFKITNAPVVKVRQFGKESNHLELQLDKNIKAIAFFASPSTYNLKPNTSFCHLHSTLEKSYFMNRPEIRLRIVNIEA